MDRHLLKYAERPSPRYTSYPTAPNFSADVDSPRYAEWLAAVPEDATLSFYVHVPYCKRICWYCGCSTIAAHAGDTADFADTLMQEIDLVAGRVGSKRVAELHWGGGTPNILSPEEFKRLFHYLEFWLDLDPAAAHSIEIDPRYLTIDQAAAYAAAHVTRASLGVQTLAPHVQHAIGRVQPHEQVQAATEILREAGITQLNFDLMYGLPLQTVDDVLHTIQLVSVLRPARIALFGYAHVPWFKRRQRVIGEASLPNAMSRFDQAEAARAVLMELGYTPVGIDHYALPDDPLARAAQSGRVHRNFQGYVAEAPDAVIGVGPSAISRLPQGYVQNQASVGAWRRSVDAGELPTARGHAFNSEDLSRAAIIEQLMCAFEVDLALYGGREAFATELAALGPLTADGLVRIDGERVVILSAMRPFSRLVAQAFDAYAGTAPAHHAGTI